MLSQIIFYAGNYRNARWPHEGTTGTSLHTVDFKDLNFFLILRLWVEPTRAWTIRVSTLSPPPNWPSLRIRFRVHLVSFWRKGKDWFKHVISQHGTDHRSLICVCYYSVCVCARASLCVVCVCARLCVCVCIAKFFCLFCMCVVVRHGGSMSF